MERLRQQIARARNEIYKKTRKRRDKEIWIDKLRYKKIKL